MHARATSRQRYGRSVQQESAGEPTLDVDWLDAVQYHWDKNGRRFSTHDLDDIREAALSLPPESTGVPGCTYQEFLERPTSDLLELLREDGEEGWELIARVVYRDFGPEVFRPSVVRYDTETERWTRTPL